jgi:hypothetical protein
MAKLSEMNGTIDEVIVKIFHYPSFKYPASSLPDRSQRRQPSQRHDLRIVARAEPHPAAHIGERDRWRDRHDYDDDFEVPTRV